MFRRVLLTAAFCVLLPSAASAQIYVWHDAAGNLVMSTERKDPAAKTYAFAAASTFRVTRPIVGARAATYETLIADNASANSLSPDFVRAVIAAESAFNPRARSMKGAMGLMQLMPETAADYHVTNAYDPAENIRAGTAYLKSLLDRYRGDESLALAAYNAGPQAVAKYGDKVPPYRETRAYVARVRNSAETAAVPRERIYRTVRIVNGQPQVVYTDKPSAPAAAAGAGGQ
jgi:soluble lytic murein transglycosylase-like protein